MKVIWAEITGKFQSLDDMAALLHLKQSVGKFKARQHPFEPTEWVLYDILVRIDLNANGTVATGGYPDPTLNPALSGKPAETG